MTKIYLSDSVSAACERWFDLVDRCVVYELSNEETLFRTFGGTWIHYRFRLHKQRQYSLVEQHVVYHLLKNYGKPEDFEYFTQIQ